MVRLYLKTNTIIGSAKTMPTKYIERKLAERVVVLLRTLARCWWQHEIRPDTGLPQSRAGGQGL